MLKKINRIDKKKDFGEVMEKGRLWQSPFFGLKVLKGGDGVKFGFVISRKISKKAVDRNKIKRVLAEVVRKKMESEKVEGRMIFLIKKKALGVKYKDFEVEIDRLWKDLG